MVFSSIPAYLDPSNWQQQQNHQIIGSSAINPLLTPQQQQQQPGPPPPPPPQHHGAGAGSVRPNSMSERARIANIPMPETALKCPRCDSTNTKFCYFNNYSLSQPRHFCKACRRYWTRGGALRNVPVGGGCRRNKRSKSTSSSKSPASNDRQNTPNSTSNLSISTNSANILGLTQPQLPPLRFMSQLSQLTDNFASDMGVGLSYSGITAPVVGTSEMNFHGTGNNLFGSSGGGMASLLSSGVSGGIEPWRLQQQVQQFPFFGGLDSSPGGGIYHFQGGEPGFLGGGVGGESTSQQVMRPKLSSSMLSQTASVKMEENNAEQQMNLPRQLMLGGTMNQGSNHEQWNNTNAANWTDLSSFSSSSTSNQL